MENSFGKMVFPFFGGEVDVAKYQVSFGPHFETEHQILTFFAAFGFFWSTMYFNSDSNFKTNLFGKVCFCCWVDMDRSLDYQQEYGRP